MKPQFLKNRIILIPIACVLCAVALMLWHSMRNSPTQDTFAQQEALNFSRTSKHRDDKDDGKSAAFQEQIRQVEEFAKRLSEASDPETQDRIYREWLRFNDRLLLKMTPAEASQYLQTILRSKINANTGKKFEVGRNGWLVTADSLRVNLLDTLELIDPAAAIKMAREIIQLRDDQNEYAIALRTLAHDKSKEVTQTEIDSAFRMMMQEPEWRAQPSDGFLEALDVPVSKPSAATVSELIRFDAERSESFAAVQKQVDNAATLSLDRIMLRKPDIALDAINSSAGGMEALSPNYLQTVMLRVNITTEKGSAAVRDFLRNPAIPQAQKDFFLASYPNGNYFSGSRLVSKTELYSRHKIYHTYRESYAALEQMKASGDIDAAHADRLLANVAKYFPKE